jgi:hypothetical protein
MDIDECRTAVAYAHNLVRHLVEIGAPEDMIQQSARVLSRLEHMLDRFEVLEMKQNEEVKEECQEETRQWERWDVRPIRLG